MPRVDISEFLVISWLILAALAWFGILGMTAM
jgi:hypothetical protein